MLESGVMLIIVTLSIVIVTLTIAHNATIFGTMTGMNGTMTEGTVVVQRTVINGAVMIEIETNDVLIDGSVRIVVSGMIDMTAEGIDAVTKGDRIRARLIGKEIEVSEKGIVRRNIEMHDQLGIGSANVIEGIDKNTNLFVNAEEDLFIFSIRV